LQYFDKVFVTPDLPLSVELPASQALISWLPCVGVSYCCSLNEKLPSVWWSWINGDDSFEIKASSDLFNPMPAVRC
jgi:hypothetical protein